LLRLSSAQHTPQHGVPKTTKDNNNMLTAPNTTLLLRTCFQCGRVLLGSFQLARKFLLNVVYKRGPVLVGWNKKRSPVVASQRQWAAALLILYYPAWGAGGGGSRRLLMFTRRDNNSTVGKQPHEYNQTAAAALLFL